MTVTVNKATLQVVSGVEPGAITINKATLQVVSGVNAGWITVNKTTLQVVSGPLVALRRRQIALVN